MLGESPYTTRDELLQRMVTGLAPEVDAATQGRFNDGHAVEIPLRAVAEKQLGEPLYAFVGVPDDEHSLLSASFDGCTFVGDTTAECKLLNQRLRAAFADMESIAPAQRERSAAKCLPIDYRIQLEQQVRVAEAERALFLAGQLRDDGTLGDTFSCWYYPDDALWARIQAGWVQLAQDRETYQAPVASVEAVAAPMESLPAVVVRMDGNLQVIDNLPAFGEALRAFIARIPTQPTTDEDFATCEAACKALKKAEESLEQSEAAALASMADVEKMRRLVGDMKSLARETRLAREKDVKRRKEEIKREQVERGRGEFARHIEQLNARLGKNYMPTIATDFPSAISGLKKFDNLRGAINQHLADKKIEANAVADRIALNLNWLREHADKYRFLFADVATLVLDAPDAMQAKAQLRINEHEAAEEKRLQAERDRIRAEEAARLEREQQAKLAAEARAREEAQAPAPAASAAPAPASKPTAPSTPAANSSTVVPIQRGKPTLRLGEINERLAPLSITEAGLVKLGFAAAARERSSCLYHEADFAAMCDSIVAHVRTAQQREHEAEAA